MVHPYKGQYPQQQPAQIRAGQPVQPAYGPGQQIINTQKERFIVLSDPGLRRQYVEEAERMGVKYHPDWRLQPLVQSDNTTLNYNTANHPGIPVSLNDNVPNQALRIYFQDAAFIRSVTATVLTPVWKAEGIPGFSGTLPPPFEPQVLTDMSQFQSNVLDFIFVQFRRDGAGQIYHEEPVPLSSVCGTGKHPYFWMPIPVMKPGGSLLLDLSLIPPGQTNIPTDEPSPFLDRVGYIQIDMHVEKFQPMGLD